MAATRKPTQKVAAGGIAGATTTVLVWILSMLNVDMPPEVAAALVVIISSGAAYIRKEEK